MKLYMHPVSTTSRAVMLFIADNNLPVEPAVVDILTGEHMQAPFAEVNPSKLIPVLEDGGFRLTESAAILRYLAQKFNSPAYPSDPQKQARINEVMDWFNSNFYRDYGYGLIYPQLFPHLKRENPTVQSHVVEYGRDRTKAWLQVLNDHFLAGNTHLAGNELTIADYFGLAILQVGEVIRCDFSAYPNVARWLAAMKKQPSYDKIYEVIGGFAASVKEQPFVAI